MKAPFLFVESIHWACIFGDFKISDSRYTFIQYNLVKGNFCVTSSKPLGKGVPLRSCTDALAI